MQRIQQEYDAKLERNSIENSRPMRLKNVVCVDAVNKDI